MAKTDITKYYKYIDRLNVTTTQVNILDLLKSALTESAWNALAAEITTKITVIQPQINDDIVKAIRVYAAELPVGHPMRVVIESVP